MTTSSSLRLDDALELENEIVSVGKLSRFLKKQPPFSPQARQMIEVLKANGHKLTGPRLNILKAVCCFEDTFSMDQLMKRLKENEDRASFTSVFRNLKLLSELGLLHRVHSHDGCQRYTREAVSQLISCQDCRQLFDFGDYKLLELFQTVEAATGFYLEGYWLEFFGYCQDCQGIKRAEPDSEAMLPGFNP